MAATYTQTFSGETWSVSGLAHDFGSEDLIFAAYDANNPRLAVEPGQATVHASLFDLVVEFGVSFSGLLVVVAGDFAQTFPAQATWTLPGATHGLGSKALIPMCWSTGTPRQWIVPERLTVHPTSFDVVVTWGGVLVAGTLVLVEGQYLEPFTLASPGSVTATGAEHGRGTQGLLTAVYDTAPTPRWVSPGLVTVHQSTYDVVMTVGQALSGALVVHGELSTPGEEGEGPAVGYRVIWRARRGR